MLDVPISCEGIMHAYPPQAPRVVIRTGRTSGVRVEYWPPGCVTCRCACESRTESACARDDCVMVSLSCSEHATSLERHKYRTENFVAQHSTTFTRFYAITTDTGAGRRGRPRGSRAVQRRTNGNVRAGAPGDRAGTSEAVLVWAWHAQRSDGRERQRLETRRHCVRGRQSGCFPDRAP
jgi:hypothetical protein